MSILCQITFLCSFFQWYAHTQFLSRTSGILLLPESPFTGTLHPDSPSLSIIIYFASFSFLPHLSITFPLDLHGLVGAGRAYFLLSLPTLTCKHQRSRTSVSLSTSLPRSLAFRASITTSSPYIKLHIDRFSLFFNRFANPESCENYWGFKWRWSQLQCLIQMFT